MKTVQVHLRKKDFDSGDLKPLLDLKPDFIIAFADVQWATDKILMKEVKKAIGNIELVGCSTAGEISNMGLLENSMVLTGVKLENSTSKFKIAVQKVEGDQMQVGRDLGKTLLTPDLKGIFLFAPGVTIQGSTFLYGLKEVVGQRPTVAGGLAGDSGKFKQTAVFHNDSITTDCVVGLGFYGEKMAMVHSARAGFRSFGGVRKITKAENNLVYEIDDRPALKVYKEALGKHAEDLPATGLMFPFAVLNNQMSETGLIRGVLNVDEGDQSIVLAGDVQTGTYFKLMRGENQSLINGAKEAADFIASAVPKSSLALLVSCIARRMVMGEAVEDEIEAAVDSLKNCDNVAGFYSYGEFGPFFTQGDCQLHNQTMTISILSEYT